MRYLLLSFLCFVMTGCKSDNESTLSTPVEPQYGYICLLDSNNKATHKWVSIESIWVNNTRGVKFRDLATGEVVTIKGGTVLISKYDPCPEIGRVH